MRSFSSIRGVGWGRKLYLIVYAKFLSIRGVGWVRTLCLIGYAKFLIDQGAGGVKAIFDSLCEVPHQ